jgi:pSer/pThr/pTyr-binding forkhead associated (FHA) protein
MIKSKVAQAPGSVVLKPLGGGDLINMHGTTVIGRSRSCDVVINRSFMSRRHAKLVPGKWEVLVEDLGSSNGTYVNDQKISGQVYAKHKDTVRFDTLVFEIRIVVDIGEIANIHNTRPPILDTSSTIQTATLINRKVNKKPSLSTVPSLGVDDMPLIHDTLPPVASRAKVNKKTLKKRQVKRPKSAVKKTPLLDAGDLAIIEDTQPTPVLKPKTRSAVNAKSKISPASKARLPVKPDAKPAPKATPKPKSKSKPKPNTAQRANARPIPAAKRKAAVKPRAVAKPKAVPKLNQVAAQQKPKARVNPSARIEPAFAETGLSQQNQPKPVAPENWALRNEKQVKRPSTGASDRGSFNGETVQIGTVPETVDTEVELDSPGAVLIGVSKEVKGRVFTLPSRKKLTKWEVGRCDSCEVTVNDPSVSRNHAQLINDKSRWKLIDLMSANGTFVNGNKSLTSYLDSGDTVRFGQQEFLIKMTEGKSNRRGDRKEYTVWALAAATVVVGVVLLGFVF